MNRKIDDRFEELFEETEPEFYEKAMKSLKNFDALTRREQLTRGEIAVFMCVHFLTLPQNRNAVAITEKELSELTGHSVKVIRNAIKKLMHRNILRVTSQGGDPNAC
jgi:phage replication O-like protein O